MSLSQRPLPDNTRHSQQTTGFDHMSVHRKYISTTNNMPHFLNLFISVNCSTCFRRFLCPSSGAQNCTYSIRYCQINTAACAAIMDVITAGSGIGLTIPDAVCTVLCTWWWAEEPPESRRAIYRNKYVKKTLHLVGCTLEMDYRMPQETWCDWTQWTVMSQRWCSVAVSWRFT